MAQNFCYIENDEIKKVQPLPKSWKNIAGFNLITDLAKLKTFGWLPFEEVFEEYDQDYEEEDYEPMAPLEFRDNV